MAREIILDVLQLHVQRDQRQWSGDAILDVNGVYCLEQHWAIGRQ